MDWQTTPLWVIDSGHGPGASGFLLNGQHVYCLLAFTSLDLARRYIAAYVGNDPDTKARSAHVKRTEGGFRHDELTNAARVLSEPTSPYVVKYMVIDGNTLNPLFIPIEEVITFGVHRKQQDRAKDELLGS